MLFDKKKKKKILVVEDDFLIALQLTLVLRDCGYQLSDPVVTGEDAVERAKTDSPDVAIIDVTLPGELNGIKAANRIVEFCDAFFIFTGRQIDAD